MSDNKYFRFFETYTAEDVFVENENIMEALFSSLDEEFNRDYKVKMRYHRFYISHGDERYIVDVSKIKVGNIKNAIETIKSRYDRFDSEQVYDETVGMLLDVFGRGKEDVVFLNEINEQGVEINMVDDDIIGKKLRFCVYGRTFAISGRSMSKVPYKFDPSEICSLLKYARITDWFENDIECVVSKIFTCDLKTDKLVLLAEGNRVLDIVDIDKIDNKYIRSAKILILRDDCVKILILRNDYSKADIAGVLERLISGRDNNIIANSLPTTVTKPNIIIPNQVPYYRRPLLKITAGEFAELRKEVQRINKIKRAKFRDYLAKDTNEKMFGYGGVCSICSVEMDSVNSFAVKDFEAESISFADGMEHMFKFSIYMCYNDFYAAGGWQVEKISIGGMNPFMWLQEIVAAEEITPEFLHCNIRVKVSVQALDSETIEVRDAPPFDFILSPLLAAKWVEDNAG